MNRLIIFLFTLLFLANSYAQDFPITKIDGKEYYIYKVQKGEGLYRISVNFGVSQEEILSINPQIEQGLRLGENILILKKEGYQKISPQASSSENFAAESKDSQAAFYENTASNYTETERNKFLKNEEDEPHFHYHKIKKGETLYSLARHYELKPDDILKYNPEARAGYRVGEVLKIPKAEDIYTQKKKEKEEEDLAVKYLIHNVEEKETLYSISKKYNVSIEEIIKANPDLQVLQVGQMLQVPYYLAHTQKKEKEDEQEPLIDWEVIFGKREIEKMKIAFLLPLNLTQSSKRTSDRFMDFYAGAIKAIYEEKQKETPLEIYTYDCGKTKRDLSDLIASNQQLKKVDLIIGPAYSEQVATATQFAKQNKIKILIPFTSKVEGLRNNPYVFQFNPSAEAESDFLKFLFDTKFKDMNYIFANAEHVAKNNQAEQRNKQIKLHLEKNKKNYKEIDLSELEELTSDSDSIFNYRKKNLILFNTDKLSTVFPYFKELNIKNRTFDIILFEEYQWKKNATPRPTGVYISPFKAEYEMVGLNKYNRDFFNFFSWQVKNKTPRYDILGYDLTRYFIQQLTQDKENGEDINKTNLSPYQEGLQSEFHFTRESTSGGFTNRKIYLSETQKD